MQARHRGQPLTGVSSPHPIDLCLRALAACVLARAASDATNRRDPWLQEAALNWLNSDEGREMARAFGLRWPSRREPLTVADLQAMKRNIYMRGG